MNKKKPEIEICLYASSAGDAPFSNFCTCLFSCYNKNNKSIIRSKKKLFFLLFESK